MKSKSSDGQTPDAAYRYALRLLTGKDYTVARIYGKLTARGFPEQESEQALSRLQQEGWLDDHRYARRFAEAALSSGRFFGARLRMEMRRRGFPVEVISDTLLPLLEQSDEQSEIRSTLEKRYPGFIYQDSDERTRRRVISFLQRRGFSFSSIMRAVRPED